MDPKLHEKQQREATAATAASIANCASRLGKIDEKLDRLAKIDAKLDQIMAAISDIQMTSTSPAPVPTKPKAG